MQWLTPHPRRAWMLAMLGAIVALVLGASAAVAHGAPAPLTFGTYAGGVAGTPTGIAIGPPDDPAKIQPALDELQVGERPFLVRAVALFQDQPAGAPLLAFPPRPEQYAIHGRKLDLVLIYQSANPDLTNWLAYVRAVARTYGPRLGTLQIGEEPNILPAPGPDGVDRHRRAVVEGVIAAKRALNDIDLPHVQVGMNVFARGAVESEFWTAMGQLGGPRFRAALDYVGVDMYADVFQPADISDSVTTTLNVLRTQSMPLAGLGSRMPIHASENGWPTGEGRTEAQQAAAFEEGLRTVSSLRGRYNITHYEVFALRDADSSVDSIWYQFGLLHSDYTPKPAFATVRDLFTELS